MKRLLTNSQMRSADAYTIIEKKIPSETLMRRAGVAIAREVARVADLIGAKKITVVCGTGNNGGDGYVCAEELLKLGKTVNIYAISGRLSADCERERNAYRGSYTDGICCDIVVDCIFGTGLSREVAGEQAAAIDAINSSGAYVVSADIPSGLNGDNGRIMVKAVKADLTVAIAEYKAGLYLSDGLDLCGETVLADIGITCPESAYAVIYGDEDLKAFFPKRKRNSHKGTFGSANIIAGSDKYIGAAALSAEAALKSGCGYVRLTTSEKVKLSLAPRLPQVIFLDGCDLKSDAIAVGMGCGVSEKLYGSVKYLLKNFTGTLIVDADGLNALSAYGVEALKEKYCAVVLTPHIKEFSRLSGLTTEEILSDPIGQAKSFAREYGVTLVLKSASTVITDGEKTALNVRGNTALSKGGSGDMLSGYLCGCAARGLNPFDAAVCATNVLGRAAEIVAEDKTEYCATAKDILKNLHFSVRYLTS